MDENNGFDCSISVSLKGNLNKVKMNDINNILYFLIRVAST